MSAKGEGIEWVEADLDTLKHYISEERLNKSIPPGYFCYKDVKVTTPGRAAEIEEELNKPLIERLNPGSGTVARSTARVRVLSKDSVTTLEVDR